MASWKKPLGGALLVEAIGLAGFFAAAVATFSANRIIPAFAFKWERTEALLGFIRWMPALQFLGLALALGSSEGADDEIVSRAIVPATLLAIAFSALALLGEPELRAQRSSLLEASSLFNDSVAEAKARFESGDLVAARASFDLAKSISPDDARVRALEEPLSNAELKAGQRVEAPAEEEAPQRVDTKTARDYYLKALAFSDKGDHFSAHWYAQTASRLDPSYTDAKRLAAKSWEELLSRGGGAADEKTSSFYSRKLEGYGLLRSGDAIAAYAIWKELASQAPSDPDVRRFLAESLAEASKVAFFKDEYDASLKGEVIGSVFLRLAGKGGPTRILAASSASFAQGAAYFRELELIEPSDGGTGPSLSVRAPYAKLAGGRLFLVCAGREPGSATYRPQWVAGEAPTVPSALELGLATDTAYRVLTARARPASLGLVAAWRAASEAPAYGVDAAPIKLDLARRTGTPIGLFAAGLLGALAGTRFRRRGGKFPRGLYALTPFMAAAGLPAYILVGRIDDLLSAWFAAALPGFGSLWAMAGTRVLFLAAALLVTAGSRRDRGGEGEA